MSRRSEQLKAVADNFLRVHHAWANAANRPFPDESYWDAIDDLQKAFEQGDIPEESRPLAEAVNAFLDERDAFDNRDTPANLYPNESFWRAREALETALQPPRAPDLKPLESIALLASQGVSHRQIALMYGFKDRRGELLVNLVQKELDSPGSVLKTTGAVDGRDWMDPRLAERQAAQAEATRAVERASRRQEAKAEAAGTVSSDPPCKETPHELWQQNVSVQQAALMLRKSPPEVEQLFAEFDQQRDDELAGGKLVDPTTRAIRELFAAGKKPGEIVKELKVDPKKVQEALKPETAPAA